MGKKIVDLNNKTILVTGSPGFIGANLVLHLLKDMANGTIISLDNASISGKTHLYQRQHR